MAQKTIEGQSIFFLIKRYSGCCEDYAVSEKKEDLSGIIMLFCRESSFYSAGADLSVG